MVFLVVSLIRHTCMFVRVITVKPERTIPICLKYQLPLTKKM